MQTINLRSYDSAKFLSLTCMLELSISINWHFFLPKTAIVNGSKHNLPVLFELTDICTSVTIIHVTLVCFIILCQNQANVYKICFSEAYREYIRKGKDVNKVTREASQTPRLLLSSTAFPNASFCSLCSLRCH